MEVTMRELVLICPEAQAEALSDVLLEAGALSVSVEDADSDTAEERPLFGEPGLEPTVQAWGRNRVVALLPDGLDHAQLLEQVRISGVADYRQEECILRDVPDEDWVRLTQAQFSPIQVAERIWITPTCRRPTSVPPTPVWFISNSTPVWLLEPGAIQPRICVSNGLQLNLRRA
jgi:ribosomal protein L11 methyltransferase